MASRRTLRGTARAAALVLLLWPLAAATGAAQRDETDARELVRRFFAAAAGGDVQRLESAAGPLLERADATLPLLLDDLGQRKPREIVAALRLLRTSGHASSFDSVLGLAGHGSADVRAEVLVLGAALGDERVVPLLVRAARDRDPNVRRRAWDGLQRMRVRTEETLVLAADGLFDGDFWVRRCAGHVLSAWPRPEEGEDPVASALIRRASSLRAPSADAFFAILAHRAGRGALPAVLKGLRSHDRGVVAAAAQTAGRLRLAEAAGELRRLLTKSPETVRAAAEALASLADTKAVPRLVGRLRSLRDDRTRDAVIVALRRITGETFGHDVARWERYVRENL